MGDKSERIGLRATPEQRKLLEAASRAEGRSVTDFVLEHATRGAEEVLADRRVFTLDVDRWVQFTKLLDRPAEDVPGLRDLMTQPSVLDDE